MSKNIYVGNISYSVNDQELERLFTQYGTVKSARVITDRSTNQSKGFGFVEMEEASEADKAISALNGTEIDNREIRVNEAREKGNR